MGCPPLPTAFVLAAATLAAAPLALAQGAGQARSGQFAGDALVRQEWTRDVPAQAPSTETSDESRWRVQLRPRYELSMGPVQLGVGAEINYSRDRNDELPPGQEPLVRDNYRSRDLRLDLAYGRLRLGRLELTGGRMIMPIALTDLVWDRDLRPQGGAASLNLGSAGIGTRLAFLGIYAKGSHVFEDDATMYGGAVELTSTREQGAGLLQVVGSYLQFEDLDTLEPAILRQNTRVGGTLFEEYRVADVVGRLVTGGDVPVTLVADYCWNTAIDSENRGLWLSASLGALETSRARLEYTYAKVEKDATVAAFNGDDFYWNAAWEGHRVDLGSGNPTRGSVHAIAQWQRSTDELAGDGWVKRWRLEFRSRF